MNNNNFSAISSFQYNDNIGFQSSNKNNFQYIATNNSEIDNSEIDNNKIVNTSTSIISSSTISTTAILISNSKNNQV